MHTHTHRHISLRYSGYLNYLAGVYHPWILLYSLHTCTHTVAIYFLPMLLIPVFFRFLPRLLPMCLSKLPRDAVPLSAEEEAAWVDSLQGDWDIEAVDLEAIAQTNNRYVKPIGFKTAKVTGKAYVCVCVCAYKGIKRM